MANPLNLVKALKLIAGNIGKVNKEVNPETFIKALESVAGEAKGGMKINDMLTQYTPEEYAMMRTFLNPDLKSGFAVKPTETGKELVSVFSQPSGRGTNLATEGVLRGATKLDNYNVGGKLPELYKKAGFEQTNEYPFDPTQVASHVSDFTRSLEPSYVEMALNPNVAEAVSSTRGLTSAELTKYLKDGTLPAWKKKEIQANVLKTVGGLGTAGVIGGVLNNELGDM